MVQTRQKERRAWGIAKFVPSLESLSSLGLEGRNLGRHFQDIPDPWGYSKVFARKQKFLLISPCGGTGYKNPSSLEIRKKITKKLQTPPFPVSPQKHEKYTEKSREWPENDHFVIFQYFARIFRDKPGMGDFPIFSFFCRISRLEGFLYSVPPQKDLKVCAHFASL